ncbi:M56 family metallopeptidase [Subtercola lobariae]|uniref:Integral membrane protein n=1 Tax=Subtercola lobariae TaxID=1588641 RepID=A0A917BGU1_9MICO|nr:M56 family metallopeptidase [Subtercola lobariae]GGF40534.1 integral membrane protein [Subtercola lobariae]
MNSMLIASVLLAALAVLLAWPVPVLLAKAHWPSRSPGVALGVWSAIALAGGFSMIGSLVTFGLAPFSSSLIRGLRELPPLFVTGPLPPDVGLIQIFALSSAALLTAHLLLNLAVTTTRTERQRRRHRALVELLSTPLQGRPGTHIIDSPAPVAYCLPGARTVTVLSEGLVTLLSTDQLEAVIAHERGHLRQQHHIVLVAFESWRSALPWFPIATRAQVAVSLLVEMLADDQSRRFTDDETLAQAIALVGSAETEAIVRRPNGRAAAVALADRRGAGVGASSGGSSRENAGGWSLDPVTARVARLVHPEPPLNVATRAFIVGTAVVMLAIPTVLLLAS